MRDRRTFVICIERGDYRSTLAVGKVDAALADAIGEEHGLIRVIDETEEDYLYPADWFIPIRLPAAARKALSAKAHARAV